MPNVYPFGPDFDLIRQLLPQLEKANSELHRLLPRYRDVCRRFRSLLLYLLPGQIDPEPLAEPAHLRQSLLDLRNKIDAAEDLAAALYQLEVFNEQTTAVCGALSSWVGRTGANSG